MRILILLTVYLTPLLSSGQTRTIIGKVVAEYEMTIVPGVKIQNPDTVQLGTTDMNGEFKIELPIGTDQLLISFIGMEWTSVKVPTDCNNLELIIMADVIYDFVTMQTVNRRRYKRYKNIIKTHKEAFDKGLFKSKEPCVTYIFSKH